VARTSSPDRSRGLWSDAWRRFKRSKLSMLGLAIVVLFILLAWLAPVLANNKPIYVRWDGKAYFPALKDLAPISWFAALGGRRLSPVEKALQFNPDLFLDPTDEELEHMESVVLPFIPYGPYQQRLDEIFLPPEGISRHFFGTDDNGRDVAARMLHGARVSLLVGFVAVGISTLIGIFVGAVGGYWQGWPDDFIVSRLIEVMMCFPTFFLILTVMAMVDPKYLNIWTIMVVIGVTSWTGVARYTRGEFIRLGGRDFVTAAKALGARPFYLMRRHLLPNSMAPILVSASFGIAGAMLTEAALSFLGIGVQAPKPSWGNILNLVQNHYDMWWLGVFPGLAIFLGVLSYNLVGDGLRDALDPRLR